MITLRIDGEFTALELAAFLSLIAGLGNARTDKWSVNVDDPDGTVLREAENLLKQKAKDL